MTVGVVGSLAIVRETLPQRCIAWTSGSAAYVRDPPRTVSASVSGWSLGFVLHPVQRHEGWVVDPQLRSIPLAAGTGWLVPPGAEVLARWRERCDYVDVVIDDAALDGLGVRAADIRPSLEVNDPVLVNLALSLLGSPARHDPLFCDSLGHALALHVCRKHVQGWRHTEEAELASPLRTVLEYIEAHLAETLDLSTLAGLAGRSPTGLRRAFAAEMNSTPFAYVLGRRLDRAEQLLRHSDLTVSEVAARSGFGSASYLTERLRLNRGRTPAAFRRADRG